MYFGTDDDDDRTPQVVRYDNSVISVDDEEERAACEAWLSQHGGGLVSIFLRYWPKPPQFQK
jgi:hypothetical protein